jgi:hypothetical protein
MVTTTSISDSINSIFDYCGSMFDPTLSREDRVTFALAIADEVRQLGQFGDEHFLDHELNFLIETIRHTGAIINNFNKGLPL